MDEALAFHNGILKGYGVVHHWKDGRPAQVIPLNRLCTLVKMPQQEE